MSASTPLVALDGVATAHGVSVASSAAEVGGDPVAGRVLPTRAEFAAVLPWPGLRRGSTVVVHESTSLLFALLSEATAAGSWAAVVGLPGLGLAAAAEAGVELSRLALVPQPGSDPVAVISALLDGVDLVVVGRPGLVTEADARRLSTRARHRGAVLLPFGSWPGAEVRLRCTQARWHGLGQGHGHLREREITVGASGRGAASRPRSCRLLLPGRGGPVASPVPAAEIDEPSVRDRGADGQGGLVDRGSDGGSGPDASDGWVIPGVPGNSARTDRGRSALRSVAGGDRAG
ncbi:hypothetical protein OOZ19_14260 [Saccharopolyspora sp. NFXS83]|uniref:hypothetical protein n=1 Tax=Saccharopolyspora sp. NFXS83 TaxID=2993560 RepID=UPI00224AA93F|nr:hypothetical protein [Saccharopolyspora sp. NFXS83]MCX2731406.1 hypothetical protein [Saccharopolyspora sp. NFXS83]